MQGTSPTEDPIAPIARSVLSKTLRLRRGESVVIETWTHTVPWARVFSVEARRLGIRPLTLYEDEAAWWSAVEHGKAKDVGQVGPAEWAALGKASGYVFFWGPEDRVRYAGLSAETRSALTAYNGEWYQRAAKAGLRGCRMEIGRATATGAALLGVPVGAWQEELYRASLVDPSTFTKAGGRLAARLLSGKRIHITHANGTDLTLALARRKPVLDDGVVDPADVRAANSMTTIPAGVISVAVDESTAEGRFVANKTSYLPSAPASGGRWTFAGGRLAEFAYEGGGEAFAEVYEKAPAGKDRPGFLSIGLNPRLRTAPRLEDQELGAATLGLGRNEDYGGKTKIPFGSWLSLAGAHVDVDGKPLVADGVLL